MSKLIPFSLVCVLAAAPAFSGESKNLVIDRPYTYWPEPEYYDSFDPENDPIHLTDGATTYGPGMWMNKTTVGWAAGLDVPVVIHFDLGEEATIEELVFNTCGGGGAGVVEVGIRVFVSLDDKSYILAAEHTAPPPPPEDARKIRTGVQIKLPLKQTRARYVAVAAKAPLPFYFVFVDEIEIHGRIPADPKSGLPVLSAISASGVKGFQETLSGGKRAANLVENMTSPIERHVRSWPADQAEAQLKEIATAMHRTIGEADQLPEIRAGIIENPRKRARQVYGAETLVWEVVPDEEFTMVSMPTDIKPRKIGQLHTKRASVHTAINALEATALGVTNLTESKLPLKIKIRGKHRRGPTITPRVGRFFLTTNSRMVPDALLLTDSPQVIPSGESRFVWIGVESTGARAGVYDYEVLLLVGDHLHRVPFTVFVHDVTLSLETPLGTGNWSDLNTGEFELAPMVRQTMLEHRITIGAGGGVWPTPKKNDKDEVIRPVELDSTDLDKFLAFHKDFPQVSIFIAFNQHIELPTYEYFGPVTWMDDEFKGIFREWISGIIDRFKAAGRDYDEFMIMIFDETLDKMVSETCELVHSVDPKVRMKITIPQASEDAVAQLVAAGMNVFNHHAVRTGYDKAPDGYPTLSSGGRELHFYGAADAAFGSGKERDPLGFFRYLHWTAFLHGATGVHFWNMLHNNGGSPIWGEEAINDVYWPMVYPVGPPRYPEPPADVQTAEKVIPSRRWEYVRMGIEDYMLLKMASERIEKLGNAGARHQRTLDEIIKSVVMNRDSDRELFRRKRRELVEFVALLGKS